MKRGKVIKLSDYRTRRLSGAQSPEKAGCAGLLRYPDQLRELFDRNISLKVWQKGIN